MMILQTVCTRFPQTVASLSVSLRQTRGLSCRHSSRVNYPNNQISQISKNPSSWLKFPGFVHLYKLNLGLKQPFSFLIGRNKTNVVKPYNLQGNVKTDTLLFAHSNDSFFKVLSYFGVFQFAMWTYLSLFAFQNLKAVPIVQDTSEMPWYKKLLFKQGQYKNALSLLSLVVGGVVLFITFTYPQRVIKSLWLLKGGNQVRIATYSWMGKTHTFTRPVDHLSCMEARTGKGQQIPMKIKDTNFYFIIDKRGSFPKADLFDHIIGLKRKF